MTWKDYLKTVRDTQATVNDQMTRQRFPLVRKQLWESLLILPPFLFSYWLMRLFVYTDISYLDRWIRRFRTPAVRGGHWCPETFSRGFDVVGMKP